MGQAASLTHDKFIMRIIHDEINKPSDASDVDTPRGESAKNEVQRLRGMIHSRKLGEDAVSELKESFDVFDKDGSGEIDARELGHLIKNLGLQRTKEQLHEMILKVDEDDSGEISFAEFCEMLGLKIARPEDKEDIEIGYDEPYGTVMFSQVEDRFFYKEGDIDDLIIIAAANAAQRAADKAAEQQMLMFRKTFDEFDSDGSGEIDVPELQQMVKAVGLERTEEELTKMVMEVDDDGSGEIGFDEFCVLVRQMLEQDGGNLMAVMDGSKRKEMELLAQRKRDSGALIMWSALSRNEE